MPLAPRIAHPATHAPSPAFHGARPVTGQQPAAGTRPARAHCQGTRGPASAHGEPRGRVVPRGHPRRPARPRGPGCRRTYRLPGGARPRLRGPAARPARSAPVHSAPGSGPMPGPPAALALFMWNIRTTRSKGTHHACFSSAQHGSSTLRPGAKPADRTKRAAGEASPRRLPVRRGKGPSGGRSRRGPAAAGPGTARRNRGATAASRTTRARAARREARRHQGRGPRAGKAGRHQGRASQQATVLGHGVAGGRSSVPVASVAPRGFLS